MPAARDVDRGSMVSSRNVVQPISPTRAMISTTSSRTSYRLPCPHPLSGASRSSCMIRQAVARPVSNCLTASPVDSPNPAGDGHDTDTQFGLFAARKRRTGGGNSFPTSDVPFGAYPVQTYIGLLPSVEARCRSERAHNGACVKERADTDGKHDVSRNRVQDSCKWE